MNRRDPHKRKYTRVEDRKDYVPPKDIKEKLDHLEESGDLKGVLSPSLISDRLERKYDDFGEVLKREKDVAIDPEEAEWLRKEILHRACNLAHPIMNQVIAKFKKISDVYPALRDDIRTECVMVVLDVFKRQRFDYTRGTRLSSFLYELFRYAVLGVTSKFFKDKKKFVPIDPSALAGKIESGSDNYGEVHEEPSLNEE